MIHTHFRTLTTLLLLLFCFNRTGSEESNTPLPQKQHYSLPYEPIDVIIPCTEKDLPTLHHCIEGIKKYGKNVRRVIVISPEPFTEKAEWFDENNYPFNKFDIALQIFGDEKKANELASKPSRLGWIFQQFIKLYAPFVIPDISSNVLVLDADTIFLRPIEFLGPLGEGLYNTGTERHPPYFVHMSKLIPGFTRVFPDFSGISHHMLFQKSVLEDLLNTIESIHHIDAWKALCNCIDIKHFHRSSLSEYEIYFNFVFAKTDQVKIRLLKWKNISEIDQIPICQKEGYHFVSCHDYLRKH